MCNVIIKIKNHRIKCDIQYLTEDKSRYIESLSEIYIKDLVKDNN